MATWKQRVYEGEEGKYLLGVEWLMRRVRLRLSETRGGGDTILGALELGRREVEALARQLDYWLTLQEHPEHSWRAVFCALVAANFDHAAAAHIADLAEEGITATDITDASKVYAAGLAESTLELEGAGTEEAGVTVEHPAQPFVFVKNIKRFKENAIVRFLLDAGPFDMNQLRVMQFSDEDRRQFAQLIGYSECGYHELNYVYETEENDRV